MNPLLHFVALLKKKKTWLSLSCCILFFYKEGINFSLSFWFKMLSFAFSALQFKRKHLSVEKRNDNYRLKIVSILI